MNDFDYDVMQKKRIAHQARYRKCGSKSKKCSLGSDHMTRKQWERKCGEVMTYQLNRPMTWTDFKAQPIHIQQLYLENIIQTYGVTATDLGRMFGVNRVTVTHHCQENGFQVHFMRGKRMDNQQREAFERFLSEGCAPGAVDIRVPQAEDSAQPDDRQACAACDAVQADVYTVPAPCTDQAAEDASDAPDRHQMGMTEFTLRFSGEFDPGMLHNSLMYMLRPGTPVELEIRCAVKAKCG